MKKNVSQVIDDFIAIPISRIGCNDVLDAAVFVKVGEKFIKFKEKGDFIPPEKFDYFISKNVKELYVHNSEKDAFEEALDENRKLSIDNLVKEVGEENRDIVEQNIAMKEAIYEVFLDETITPQNLQILNDQVASFVETVKNKKPASDVFVKISNINNNIAEHSLNVANFSLLFGMVSGQTNPIVLENLYMGAILHDYGKAKIPAEVLEKPNSIAFDKAMKSHPDFGVELLKGLPNLAPSVLSIIAEHHEQFGGVGYPKGISGDSIYGLTRIVSIANIFDNIVTENRSNKGTMYKTAMKVLEYDKGKQFDPKYLPRILEVLRVAFGKQQDNL